MENGPDMKGKIPTVVQGENAKMAELINQQVSGGGSSGPVVKFHYFPFHGRGCAARFVGHYLKGCDFQDIPMTMDDHKAKKASGEITYGSLPIIYLDGVQMAQTNSIIRYLGRTFRGLNNEVLYPDNSNPKLMYDIDNVLELSQDMLNSYAGLVVPFFDSFKERDTKIPQWLDETLPKFLQKLSDIKKGVSGPYLVTDHCTVADLSMFSHFWKLAPNPKRDERLHDGIKEKVYDEQNGYPLVAEWLKHMMFVQMTPVVEKITKVVES